MKTFLLALGALIAMNVSVAQSKRTIPSVMVQDINGKSVNTSKLSNDGHPMVINFWATWCAPCKRELNTIAEEYEDWVEETGVKVVAVSIDDARSKARVKPYVNAQDWEYEVLLDPNGDFQRAVGFSNPPYTMLVNGKGEIVYTHTGYVPGDEEELYEEILKLAESTK